MVIDAYVPPPRLIYSAMPQVTLHFSPRTPQGRRFWRHELSFFSRWSRTLTAHEHMRDHTATIMREIDADWEVTLASMPATLREQYAAGAAIELLRHPARFALEQQFANLIVQYDELFWIYGATAAGALTSKDAQQAQHWISARLRGVTRLFGRSARRGEDAYFVQYLREVKASGQTGENDRRPRSDTHVPA
jgi:hypothetical protein